MIRNQELYKNSPYAELKSCDSNARLRIYTYSYEFPNATNRDDADWYMNYISLSINNISAEVNAPVIEGRVLEILLREVEEFKLKKREDVDFYFTEPQLGFSISNKNNPHESMIVEGELINSSINNSAHVNFTFNTNKELLDNFIKGIRETLLRFPPRYHSW